MHIRHTPLYICILIIKYMKPHNNTKTLTAVGLYILYIVGLLTFMASCQSPKVLEKRADGFYGLEYKGTTYISDDRYTKP